MSQRNNQNNNYNGNQYYGNNGQYYGGNNGQYYNQNGQYYNQNGQYGQNNRQYYKQNKFGLYDQPQQNNNNKKPGINKPLLIKIGMFAAFAIILLLIVFAINSCGKKKNVNEDVRIVGSEKLGYVSIPSDWVNFKNVDPVKSGVQYSDISGTYILTLDALSTKEIGAKDFALGYANELEKAGVSVQGSEGKLGKYNTYQVYGQHTKGVWVQIYFFEAEDGNTHYVGIEGPDKNNEAFKIPETFTLKK